MHRIYLLFPLYMYLHAYYNVHMHIPFYVLFYYVFIVIFSVILKIKFVLLRYSYIIIHMSVVWLTLLLLLLLFKLTLRFYFWHNVQYFDVTHISLTFQAFRWFHAHFTVLMNVQRLFCSPFLADFFAYLLFLPKNYIMYIHILITFDISEICYFTKWIQWMY